MYLVRKRNNNNNNIRKIETKIILNLCSFVVLITLLFILGCSVHEGSSVHQCTTAAVD